jgi:hypothetical protein
MTKELFVSRRDEVYRDRLSTDFDEYRKSLPNEKQQDKFLWERFLLSYKDNGSIWFYELMVDTLDLLENKIGREEADSNLYLIVGKIKQRCDSMTSMVLNEKTKTVSKVRVLSVPIIEDNF